MEWTISNLFHLETFSINFIHILLCWTNLDISNEKDKNLNLCIKRWKRERKKFKEKHSFVWTFNKIIFIAFINSFIWKNLLPSSLRTDSPCSSLNGPISFWCATRKEKKENIKKRENSFFILHRFNALNGSLQGNFCLSHEREHIMPHFNPPTSSLLKHKFSFWVLINKKKDVMPNFVRKIFYNFQIQMRKWKLRKIFYVKSHLPSPIIVDDMFELLSKILCKRFWLRKEIRQTIEDSFSISCYDRSRKSC